MTLRHGATDVALRRQHVLTPQSWGVAAGTDFWFMGSVNGMLTAGNGHELSDYGWTTTALSLQNGSAADFLSTIALDPGNPGAILFDAASDLLLSPAIFGDYQHAYQAEVLLGFAPSQLCLEAIGAFTVATNNETATGFGFIEDGGSPITVADHMAYIFSNGTNFAIRNGATTTDTGAAVDTNSHKWKMVITSGGSIEWFIDGTSQGTISIQDDEWPASFGAGVLATTGANRFQIGMVHIWYA